MQPAFWCFIVDVFFEYKFPLNICVAHDIIIHLNKKHLDQCLSLFPKVSELTRARKKIEEQSTSATYLEDPDHSIFS